MDFKNLIVSTLFLVVTSTKEYSPCGGKPADVYFALDSSGSIKPEEFEKERSFTKDVTSMFDTNPDRLRVGALSFSMTVKPEFGLGAYENKGDLNRKLADISYEGLGTNTGEALRFLRTKGLSKANVRPDVPRIAIILTDGMSQNPKDTLKEAELIHGVGITVFVIGIGNQVDKKELNAMASKPSNKYVLEVADFDALSSIKESLAIKACKVEALPDNTQNAAEVEAELHTFGSCTPRQPLDLVFAVDSAAIGAINTMFVFQFIGNVSENLNMEMGDTSISTLGNGCGGGIFGEEDATDAKTVKEGLSAYKIPKYDQLLRNMRMKAARGREYSKHLGILFISEKLLFKDYRKSRLEVKRAKYQDVSISVIGIGDRVDDSQAKSFTVNGGQYFKVFNFETLADVARSFLYNMCVFGTMSG